MGPEKNCPWDEFYLAKNGQFLPQDNYCRDATFLKDYLNKMNRGKMSREELKKLSRCRRQFSLIK